MFYWSSATHAEAGIVMPVLSGNTHVGKKVLLVFGVWLGFCRYPISLEITAICLVDAGTVSVRPETWIFFYDVDVRALDRAANMWRNTVSLVCARVLCACLSGGEWCRLSFTLFRVVPPNGFFTPGGDLPWDIPPTSAWYANSTPSFRQVLSQIPLGRPLLPALLLPRQPNSLPIRARDVVPEQPCQSSRSMLNSPERGWPRKSKHSLGRATTITYHSSTGIHPMKARSPNPPTQ